MAGNPILGVHAFGHEAGACVLTPASLWAMSEERLSRRKYDGSFPHRAIAWALSAAGAAVGDVELVVYDLLGGCGEQTRAALEALGFRCPIHACLHHDAHAASAYFASPFDDAAVLVVDAGGSKPGEYGPGGPGPLVEPEPGSFVDRPPPRAHAWPHFSELQTTYRGRGGALSTLRRTYGGPPWGVGPGVLYGMSSMFLGFGPMGAGTVMGLAPFGTPPDGLPSPLFRELDGAPLVACEGWPLREELLATYYADLFGGVRPRSADEPLTPAHEAVAAYVQRECEAAVVAVARRLAEETGARRLCVAGGFGLNVVTNRRLLTDTPFDEVFVQPAATDAGIPYGCALWGHHVVLGRAERHPMTSAFLGGAYDDAAVTAAVDAALERHPELRAARPTSLEDTAARALAGGRVIGWLQGRSEFGPRALGGRSVLADPRHRATVERLNRDIKVREPFRPYAPIVLEPELTRWFDAPLARSPYMLFVADVRPERRSQLPAVTHVDGSARVQTVSPDDQPRLARLLRRFDALTGVPVLLDTSFNRRGEPIVETPADAIDMLTTTGLDALAIGDLWVEKTRAPRATSTV